MFVQCRQVVWATALSTVLCAVRAEDAKTQARAAAMADGVSSVVGVAAGAPVNPLLPVLGIGFKAVTFKRAESLPAKERPRAYAIAAAGWQGSAAGNVCFAASALSGGAFLPACVVVGVAWGWKTWKASERERQDAERCAALRASVRKRNPRCALPASSSGIARHAAPSRIEQHQAPAHAFVAAQDLVGP